MALREIYCLVGKRNVSLPDEAWDMLGPGVTIPPCGGCEHSDHRKRLLKINGYVERANLTGTRIEESYEHNAGVVKKFGGEELVICSCDCTVHYSDWKNGRFTS